MPDEKWQKVRGIFDSALRLRPAERRSFVSAVCGEDKSLLAEVESLLSSHDSAESFMETPAVAKVADMIEPATKKLEKGSSFGHYEIVEQICEGGMGEVYLARDTKLDRAFDVINQSLDRREGFMFGYGNYLALDRLKSDPRWKDVSRRINLPPKT